MTIEEIQEEIVDEFSMFDDWMQRYEYMIELGKSLPLIDDQYKTDDNINLLIQWGFIIFLLTVCPKAIDCCISHNHPYFVFSIFVLSF